VAGAFESGAQIGVVANFAVVDDHERAGFVGHPLTAARKIDDAQASLAEVGVPIVVETEIVTSAMSKGPQSCDRGAPRCRNQTSW
jgi:hypothetical protein